MIGLIGLSRKFSRLALAAASCAALGALVPVHRAAAQDTTFRGITLVGKYDPLRDKVAVAVLAVNGAFGDSVRTIVQRDLQYSDRFTVVPIDSTPGGPLNYALFAKLGAAAVVQITPVSTGLHVAMHDVSKGQVVNVGEFALPSSPLSRDWRMAVHRTSDEIERWVTGQRGIAATRIAYMRGAAIRVVDSDGAEEITVPTEENGISPAWSPNGGMLAYTTYGPSSRVLVIDLTTGQSRTLTGPVRNASFNTPVFFPDGASIVFARASEAGSDLYAMGVHDPSSAMRRLTVSRGAVNAGPTVSPDGRRIAYVGNSLGRPELYIMNADGTSSDVLTNYDFSEKNYRSDPDWSSDGRLIAYQERINGRFQLRTIRTTGSTPKLLTSEGENEQPSWAPDGRHLVFTSTRTGVRQLWIMDTESGSFRQLTRSPGSRLAAWSPRLVVP
jgi:TolB protein